MMSIKILPLSVTNKMDTAETVVNFPSKEAGRSRRCSSCLGPGHSNARSGDGLSSSNSFYESTCSSRDKHCHDSKLPPDVDRRARRKLIIAIVISFLFMLAEVAGGVFAHSLAIVSDAAHLLTDLASFLISLVAIYLASRKATKKLSFGWYRAEILGALVSILFLWVITGVLCYMAVERVIEQTFEVNAEIMLITAGCGVAFNLIMGLTLHPGHGHSHGSNDDSHDSLSGSSYSSFNQDNEKVGLVQSHPGSGDYGAINDVAVAVPETKVKGHGHGHDHKTNINVRAAFIHVLGDLLQSIGVLIAAFIIYFKPEWKLADPICTFLFSVIVLVTTLTVLKDILVVLMEGTPRGISMEAVYESLRRVPYVEDIHDLRIWSLSMDKVALSVHIAVKKSSNPLSVLQQASTMIQDKFHIVDVTIQVEEYVQDMLDCTHCQDLPD